MGVCYDAEAEKDAVEKQAKKDAEKSSKEAKKSRWCLDWYKTENMKCKISKKRRTLTG